VFNSSDWYWGLEGESLLCTIHFLCRLVFMAFFIYCGCNHAHTITQHMTSLCLPCSVTTMPTGAKYIYQRGGALSQYSSPMEIACPPPPQKIDSSVFKKAIVMTDGAYCCRSVGLCHIMKQRVMSAFLRVDLLARCFSSSSCREHSHCLDEGLCGSTCAVFVSHISSVNHVTR
jgi:hypothetical protein